MVNKPSYIFDFDGTLVQSVKLMFECVNALADEYKIKKMDMTRFDYYRGLGTSGLLNELGLNKEVLSEFVTKMQSLMQLRFDKVELYPDVSRVLTDLNRQGNFIGIVTTNKKENVINILEKNKINFFNSIITDVAFSEKPNAIKQMVLENSLDSVNTYYVGDETRDIEAAKVAGVKSIAVTYGMNTKEVLQKSEPDIITDVFDIVFER